MVGLEVLEREAGVAIDELVVELPDAAGAVDAVCRGVRNVPGVGVEEVTELFHRGSGPGGNCPDRSDRHRRRGHVDRGLGRADRPSDLVVRPVLAGVGRRAVAGVRRDPRRGPSLRCSGWRHSPRALAAEPTRPTTPSVRGSSSNPFPTPGLSCVGAGPSPSVAESAGRLPCLSWSRPASSWRWAGRTTVRADEAAGQLLISRAMMRIGFVGSGLIAWAHGLGLKAMIDGGVIDASIVAVHDPRERQARGFLDVVGGDGADLAADANEVAERADAVWICTPTAAHRPAMDAALAAGRSVFCEKPLDLDLTRAQSMAEAAAASGLATQCGLVLRSAPVFRALRDLVANGTLGAPMAAVFRDDQFFPIQGHYASRWRSDVTQAGGGCLIEHSIHDVDILRFCFGEVLQVSARTANFAGYHRDRGPCRRHDEFRVGTRSTAHERVARDSDSWFNPSHRGVLPRRDGMARQRVSRTPAHTDRRRNGGARTAPPRRGSTTCRCRTTRLAWRCGPMWRRTGPSRLRERGYGTRAELGRGRGGAPPGRGCVPLRRQRRPDLPVLTDGTPLPVQQRELPLFRVWGHGHRRPVARHLRPGTTARRRARSRGSTLSNCPGLRRPESNSVGWLIWHLTRVQDHHIAEVLGSDQLWVERGLGSRRRARTRPDQHRIRAHARRGPLRASRECGAASRLPAGSRRPDLRLSARA